MRPPTVGGVVCALLKRHIVEGIKPRVPRGQARGLDADGQSDVYGHHAGGRTDRSRAGPFNHFHGLLPNRLRVKPQEPHRYSRVSLPKG
jgi:hypothetical protein